MLGAPLRRHRKLDHDVFEKLLEALAVMHVRSGHDDRQRDASERQPTVAEDAALLGVVG